MNTNSDVIIGLDLAERTGICVLLKESRKILYSGSVKLGGPSGKRLVTLNTLLTDLLGKYSNVEIAIEDVFLPVVTSPRTPISLGELRGVALLCAELSGAKVFFYPPAKMKLAVTGSGRAKKNDVIDIIEREFNLSKIDDNQADAIGIAYTHWMISNFNSAIV
ncbi:MAG: crossover junction endodeoxyribonuclease RuvC [Candidatus Riflebacteria bacterium]|nr:crossover junction endodeoxyribonuclease RuvC [Candidatus Riflebacteria bacterium]